MVETETKVQRYKRYIDSGVEWLGEVPEQWEVLPSKRFHKVEKQLNTKRVCDNVLSLTLRGVVNNNPDSPEGMVPKDYATYQVFDKNNLVFKLIDLENVRTSRVGIVHEKGIMSSAYIRLVIGQGSFPRFAYYYFFSLYINEVYNNLGSGVRSTLGPNDLLNIPFIKPPLSEQTAIAQFLDDKTTKIDEAITIKKQQISLLKERKQILIHKAVTQGLNPKVKLKDSGVEWIGDIPEHWEVKRLKYVAEINYGISPNEKTYNNQGLGTVLVNGPVEYSKSSFGYTRSLKWTTEPVKFAKKDDLLFCLRGSTTGRLNLCHQDLSIGRGCASIRGKENHQFIIKAVTALKDQIIETFKGSTFPSITSFELNNYSVPNPPRSEQKEISVYIETASQKIESAISLKQQELAKLKEYKSSLINSVVTGKVKVC